ncbi:trypsin-like serine protease [Ramicandelaber brevisporus]|nr:trypsin-like serine protease [Ramicandelaber brevisporus]KAI8868556.1 trypsin-like serine protease [Ramicandelaber brevisporus]
MLSRNDLSAPSSPVSNGASPSSSNPSATPLLSRRLTRENSAVTIDRSGSIVVDVSRLLRRDSLLIPRPGQQHDDATAEYALGTSSNGYSPPAGSDIASEKDIAEAGVDVDQLHAALGRRKGLAPTTSTLTRSSTFKSSSTPAPPPISQPPTHLQTPVPPGVAISTSEEHLHFWERTIEHAVKAIVCIRGNQPRPFDQERSGRFNATGFVVDAEQGIILTNRHVACAGPFEGEAIFLNQEKAELRTIYRDPVHDFGFLKYDPKKVRYFKPTSLILDPNGAAIGTEVKVIGNDAGEDISILSGHISRIDRNPPSYGPRTYNDFNTFYLQSAASLSGGSSGSPVIDVAGNVVGLQAGGRVDSATNYFLPLHRVLRALEFIRRGEPVPRGTIQVKWEYQSYDALSRLGLGSSIEGNVRRAFPDGKGMLVAATVLPSGPSDSMITNSDILYSINGRIVTEFQVVDDILDRSIGMPLKIVVVREGEFQCFSITVQDLHSITPDRLLYATGSVIHDLSYVTAMNSEHAVSGVYIANGRGPFQGGGALIVSLNGIETPDLATFMQVYSTLPDNAPISFMWRPLSRTDLRNPVFAYNERHFFETCMYVRNDATGLWDKHALPNVGPEVPPVPQTVSLVTNLRSSPAIDATTPSLVLVKSYSPLQVSGGSSTVGRGTGVIFDAKKGLIVVQSTAVHNELANIRLTFAQKIKVRGHVIFFHPHHMYCIIRYDPKLLGRTPVRSAQFGDNELEYDAEYTLVGFGANETIKAHQTHINDINPVVGQPLYPARWRPINFDWTSTRAATSLVAFSSVIVDSDNKIAGIWMEHMDDDNDTSAFSYFGISTTLLKPLLSQYVDAPSLADQHLPKLRSLGIECSFLSITAAKEIGVNEYWQRKLDVASPSRPSVMMVSRVEALGSSAGILKPNDILLEVNGIMPVSFTDLDAAQSFNDNVTLTIVREHAILRNITVPTQDIVRNGSICSRFVFWGGACFQEPYRALLQQTTNVPSKVYASFFSYGSPVAEHATFAGNYITHVNNVPTPDLDAFLKAIKSSATAAASATATILASNGTNENEMNGNGQSSSYVRLRIVMESKTVSHTVSIRPNYHYWPTRELVKDLTMPTGWRWVEHSN